MTTQTMKRPQRKKVNALTTKNYQKVLDLAEAGKHQDALELIEKYLAASPKNAEILNDKGAILYCLHRTDEAIEHFIKANDLQPDSAEILWNLSDAYLSQQKAKDAAALFEKMQQIGILNPELLARTAEILVNSGEITEAHKILTKSLELFPNQPMLNPMLDIISRKISEN